MNKMQIAHQMALAIQGTKLLHDMELVSAMAWKYADAMQAEADKRNKAEAEQKRKEVREILSDANTFIEREGQHFDDVEWQPDWSQAPETAIAWKMQSKSNAVWIHNKSLSDFDYSIAPSFNYQGNWQDSLRKRPEALFEVDWSQAPDDATAWEYLGHGSARWHTTTKGLYRAADLFGYNGTDMLFVERPQ